MSGGIGAFVEVAVAFAAVEAALWTAGATQNVLIGVGWAWVLGTTFRARPDFEAVGLDGAGLRASLWVVPATAGLASFILILGGVAGTLHPRLQPARVLAYLPWALAQQFLAQSFFFVRFERLLGRQGHATLLTAALFGVAHLPNPVLVPTTFVAVLLFSYAFARHRNLYPLALAHVLLALAVAVAVPDAVHHGMRVGLGYWRYAP